MTLALSDSISYVRRPRPDGWSNAKQRGFIEVLAAISVVGEAFGD